MRQQYQTHRLRQFVLSDPEDWYYINHKPVTANSFKEAHLRHLNAAFKDQML